MSAELKQETKEPTPRITETTVTTTTTTTTTEERVMVIGSRKKLAPAWADIFQVCGVPFVPENSTQQLKRVMSWTFDLKGKIASNDGTLMIYRAAEVLKDGTAELRERLGVEPMLAVGSAKRTDGVWKVRVDAMIAAGDNDNKHTAEETPASPPRRQKAPYASALLSSHPKVDLHKMTADALKYLQMLGIPLTTTGASHLVRIGDKIPLSEEGKYTAAEWVSLWARMHASLEQKQQEMPRYKLALALRPLSSIPTHLLVIADIRATGLADETEQKAQPTSAAAAPATENKEATQMDQD